MEKESQICGSCSVSYNTNDRTPRVLIHCGHNLCSHCLEKILRSTPGSRKCPFDGLPFDEAQDSVDKSPLNSALLALLQGRNAKTCQTHDKKFTIFCLQDHLKICSECIGEHQGHLMKKIEDLKADAIKVKRDLEESMMKFEKNNASVEISKRRCLGKMDQKFGEINKLWKAKRLDWKKRVESLFEINIDSQLKEEACKAIEEINEACQKEENLAFLNRNFSSIISRLQPQTAKGADDVSRMMNCIESFLADQAKSIKNFDLPEERAKPEQPAFKGKQVSSEPVNFKSLLTFGICGELLKIWVDNGNPISLNMNLDRLNQMTRVNVEFLHYESLFQDPNNLNSLSQILHQLKNYTSLMIDFLPSGLTDDRALNLLKILFPKVQHLTEIELSFGECKVTNQPVSFICTEILPKATSLEYLTLRLGSTGISDLNLFPLNKNLKGFTLDAEETEITDDGIKKVLNAIEGVSELNLNFQGTGITDRSLKELGNNVMPCMKNLERFTLDVSETNITIEGVDAIFTGIPKDIEDLSLSFEGIKLPDEVINLFEEKVPPKLELVEEVHVQLGGGTDLQQKMSKLLRSIRKEAAKRRNSSK